MKSRESFDLRGLFFDDARPDVGLHDEDRLSGERFDGRLASLIFAEPRAGNSAMPLVSAEVVERPSREGRVRSSLADEMPDPGAVVDKYRLEELVGVGGFGTVYRATHLLLGTEVALKMLKPSVARSRPQLTAKLCAEARLAAQIVHENVVRILDVTHNDAITYVVMEYLDGRTLSEELRAQRPLSVAQALRMGIDVASGLAAGLQKGIIHRDVKPANILLTKNGRAKLVDFGLAIAGDRETTGPAGTPGYMAPEQAEGDVDHRVDIFGLGVVLYEAISGTSAIGKSQQRPQWTPRMLSAPTPLHELRSSVPAEVSAFIMSMMAFDKARRPQTYEEVILSLRRLLTAELSAEALR